MFYVFSFVLLFSSVYSAPVCESDSSSFNELINILADFMVDQTLNIVTVSDYAAYKLNENSEENFLQFFYGNIEKAANLLQYSVESAIETRALEDQLKCLKINSIYQKYNSLYQRIEHENPILKNVVNQYSRIIDKIEKTTTLNNPTPCHVKKLFEKLVVMLNYASLDLSDELNQFNNIFISANKSEQVFNEEWNIIKVAAHTIMELSQQLADYLNSNNLTQIEISALSSTRNLTQENFNLVKEMKLEDKTESNQVLETLKIILKNVKLIS